MAIDVCLLFKVAVIFFFNVFPFPVCTAQFIGDWLENKRGAPNCFKFCLLYKLMFGAPLVMAQGASVRQKYLNYVSRILFMFVPPLLLPEGTSVRY